MADNGAKIVIERELMQFELNLQNNYKDLAYKGYTEVHAMLDSFLEQGEINERYYKRMKKKMKKYDKIYHPEEEEEAEKEAEEKESK